MTPDAGLSPSEDRITEGLLDSRTSGAALGGPSFSRRNRIERAVFMLVWALAAAWTPPFLHRWRIAILRVFGARIGTGVRLYGTTSIWHPARLAIGDYATIGPRARIYNQGFIRIGSKAVISQGAHLCASSHDPSDPHFQLVLCPIEIGEQAWIAAEAFVGPNVQVGEGALLAARGVAFRNLDPWTIYRGNPAIAIRPRVLRA